jgi:undecaprenyl-diphosphatase
MKFQQMSMCLVEMISESGLWDGFSIFDDAVYKFVSGFISDDLTRFMKFITFLGSEWFVTLLTVMVPALIFILRKKECYRLGLLIPANIALGALFNQILKLIFERPRPELLRLVEETGYSFPSGHSMNSVIFYGLIAYLIIRRSRHWSRYAVAAFLGVLVILIGLSRIYLGVHYASDVLAGFLIGLGWLALAARISDRFLPAESLPTV